jgi:hypothetical protein
MPFTDFEDDEQEFQPVVRKKPAQQTGNAEITRKPRPSIVLEEDGEEAPKVRKVVRSGWSGVDSVKTGDSNYAVRLKLSEDTQIIRFIGDAPYASYGQHWLERSGQKSFVCIGEDCPLCKAGNRPSKRHNFNVALLTEGEDPALRSLEIGPRVIDQLKNFHNSDRTGPLDKHYWAISRTGKGATSSTLLQMVKAADLEEWGLTPLTSEQLAEFAETAYTEDIIQVPSKRDLVQIASEELGYDN